MNKILYFILLFLAVIGLLGGIGYTIYCDAWPVSVGLVAVGYLVWPKFRELFKSLTS